MDLCSQVFDTIDILVAREYVCVYVNIWVCIYIYINIYNSWYGPV